MPKENRPVKEKNKWVIGKYVSLGCNLSGKSGNVTYFHASCVQLMIVVAGGHPKLVSEDIPDNSTCGWCGRVIR